MALFTKKAVTIEAAQWDGAGFTEPTPDWLYAAIDDASAAYRVWRADTGGLFVSWNGNSLPVDPSDWIIQGVEGELYPCKDSVFQATYSPARVLDVSAMSFGDALVALKAGARVCRAGWNGKSMWLAMTPGSTIPVANARSGACLALAKFEAVNEITILPHIDMRAADGSIVCGWLASQTDMLAEDWMVVQPIEASGTPGQQDTRSRGEPRIP